MIEIMGEEEIITPVGTLEWSMGDHYVTELDLEKIRPTVEEDKKHSTHYIAQYPIPMLKVGASDEDVTKASIQAMMDVIIYIIMLMRRNEVDGLVLLVFATHQLRWDIKVVCNAYVPQLKQV